ncbi:MAG: UDP-N-acetylmuramoyl-L-alanine--D-glutamate ligase, partial [Armatimonadota bacterium]
MEEYRGKRIAVIGMARTGLAVAEAMAGLGARVVLYDRKQASELGPAIEAAQRFGAEVRVGTDEVDLAGVDILVPSPGVPETLPVLGEAVSRGVEVISEIELAYRLSRAPIIAITGTNGKTTTTVLTGRILTADGKDVFIAGNVAGAGIDMPLVTAAVRAGSDSVIVAEVSSFQLAWISSFRPRVAAMLNVSLDHMDRHNDIREYAATKARIFENQAASDWAVINAENSITAALARSLHSRVLCFARLSEVEEGAFVRGDDLIFRSRGGESRVCNRSDIRIPGEHNVENVLAAVCAALAFGASPESVLPAVREFDGVEHRLETVAVIDGVRYVNNSMCTNVEAAVRSIEAIEEPQIVIAG